MQQIHLLTSNPDKIKAANIIFNKYDIAVLPLDLDIPEIQAATSIEVARHAARQAYEQTGKPVIREDHSFFITELGFPGPFMTFADKAIDTTQLAKIITNLNSRDAYFELGAAYCDADGAIHEFSYRVPIVMSTEARGDEIMRWERLMMFPHDTKTLAELSPDSHAEVWTKNFASIARLISAT